MELHTATDYKQELNSLQNTGRDNTKYPGVTHTIRFPMKSVMTSITFKENSMCVPTTGCTQ